MRRVLIFAGIIASIFAGQALALPVNWEPNLGQNLNLGDDDSVNVGLGFNFQFQGSTYSSIYVSSNGFVSLGGDNGPGCCDGFLNGDPGMPGFLDGYARIAPAWFDMVAEFGGDNNVYLNSLDGRAVITWNNMAEWASEARNTFQLQLLANGSIIFSYLQLSDATLLSHQALIGITAGNGVVDPGEMNLFSGMQLTNTGTYYMFLSPGGSGYGTYSADGFNLDGATITFAGPAASAGDEVPEPGTIGFSIIGLAGCIGLARRHFKA
jgi:hypothetical protein